MNSLEIAKKCVRGLALKADRKLRLDVADGELRSQIESLAEAAGAILSESVSDCVLIDTESLDDFLVPKRVISCLEDTLPGAPVVVLLRKGPQDDHVDAFRALQARRLGLERCRVERVGGAFLLFGARRQRSSSATFKKLRAMGHTLDSSVLVGRPGLTAGVVQAVLEAVERHGLVKVKLTPQSSLDKQEAAVALSWATGSELVQRVGKTALLYRSDVKLAPPVRRNRRR